MGKWTNFLDSNAFFLVAVIAILSLILIFIIVLTIGQQSIKKLSKDNFQDKTNSIIEKSDSIEIPNRKNRQEDEEKTLEIPLLKK